MELALDSASLPNPHPVWCLNLPLRVVCTHCLDLEVPYRGIWDLCDRIRESLTPEQQYDDVGPSSPRPPILPDQASPRRTISPILNLPTSKHLPIKASRATRLPQREGLTMPATILKGIKPYRASRRTLQGNSRLIPRTT